jgi:hypothetical protein
LYIALWSNSRSARLGFRMRIAKSRCKTAIQSDAATSR